MIIYKKITINDPLGLHLRAAVQFITLIGKYKSKITIQKGLVSVNARSILSIVQLAAAFGSELDFILEGEDAASALESIRDFFENKMYAA